MTDKNLVDLTNEDIMSSLKVIATTRNCNECEIRNCKWGTCNCEQITANAALELINRQKAEIKRLQKEVNLVTILYQDVQERTEEVKVEAYKEFAERLKKKIINTPFGINCTGETDEYREGCLRGLVAKQHNVVDMLDNLLKEMVGEEE